jgi:hypothetical protein
MWGSMIRCYGRIAGWTGRGDRPGSQRRPEDGFAARLTILSKIRETSRSATAGLKLSVAIYVQISSISVCAKTDKR